MACWSAENATKAYLRALKMGKRDKQPDEGEFISAIAAGNNAQLMVMTCAGVAGSTALSLVAAARQTGGRVVCILSSLECFQASRNALRNYGDCIDFSDGQKVSLKLRTTAPTLSLVKGIVPYTEDSFMLCTFLRSFYYVCVIVDIAVNKHEICGFVII